VRLRGHQRKNASTVGTAVPIGLAVALSLVSTIASAQHGLNREEFATAKDDVDQQRIELKGDLGSATRRASDAVDAAREPLLTERLQQLSLEAAKLTRALNLPKGQATARAKVDLLVNKLAALEADALRVTDKREGDLALQRSQLEERLRVAVNVARSAAEGQGAKAQRDFESIAARAVGLKNSIRRATSASDLEASREAVGEVESQSQRLSASAERESRPQSDLTRLVAASGLVTSIGSAVILTFVLLRMRQRLKTLSSVSPREPIDQAKSNRHGALL
jgi:hypothetical protein